MYTNDGGEGEGENTNPIQRNTYATSARRRLAARRATRDVPGSRRRIKEKGKRRDLSGAQPSSPFKNSRPRDVPLSLFFYSYFRVFSSSCERVYFFFMLYSTFNIWDTHNCNM